MMTTTKITRATSNLPNSYAFTTTSSRTIDGVEYTIYGPKYNDYKNAKWYSGLVEKISDVEFIKQATNS
jgi:hypothetical protein